ncbi:MAG: hypothetical protein KAV00_16770, partial [Phycisphaerae bacterium]|nr:hypothetical protein [Phycisphaerae bacterium]
MMRATSVLAVLAAMVLTFPEGGFAADDAKTTNIAPNPGAEKAGTGKLPEGWSRYGNTPSEAGAIEHIRHGGKRSAYLKVTGFGKAGLADTGLT